MFVSDMDIAMITQDVWRAFVGLEVDGPVPTAEFGRDDHPSCGASIEIGGAWRGRVVLDCSPVLAGAAAAQVYGVSPESVDGQMMGELMAELANQIGGNLKSLLPQGCQLSLPNPIIGRSDFQRRGLDAVPTDGDPANERHFVSFERDGHRFDVAILGHT